MSRVLPILIITVLAFGCTNALSIKGFNEKNTYIYSDFKIISNSNILSSEISKVFEKEINKEGKTERKKDRKTGRKEGRKK